jgi:hypothetical protein
VRAVVITVAALMLVSADVATPAAARETDSATKTYCDAALKAARYTGPSARRLHELLDPVVARAPATVAGWARTIHVADVGSIRFNTARAKWIYDTTGLCCGCKSQYSPPVVAAVVPT